MDVRAADGRPDAVGVHRPGRGIGRPAAGPTAGNILPLLLPPLLSWRAVFWVFGLVGVVWCVVFALSFRNRPEEKPEVNAAELAMIRAGGTDSLPSHAGVPWRRILTSPNLWLLWLSYACLSYCWWFYMTYLPDYLEQNRNVPAASILGAVGKGGPLCMGALGCIVGGLLTDWFIRRSGSRRWGRRLFGVLGLRSDRPLFLVLRHEARHRHVSGDDRPGRLLYRHRPWPLPGPPARTSAKDTQPLLPAS